LRATHLTLDLIESSFASPVLTYCILFTKTESFITDSDIQSAHRLGFLLHTEQVEELGVCTRLCDAINHTIRLHAITRLRNGHAGVAGACEKSFSVTRVFLDAISAGAQYIGVGPECGEAAAEHGDHRAVVLAVRLLRDNALELGAAAKVGSCVACTRADVATAVSVRARA